LVFKIQNDALKEEKEKRINEGKLRQHPEGKGFYCMK